MSVRYRKNVDLDALLVSAGIDGGIQGFLAVALRLGFATPSDATGRGKWLKRQSQAYRDEVVAKIMEMDGEVGNY